MLQRPAWQVKNTVRVSVRSGEFSLTVRLPLTSPVKVDTRTCREALTQLKLLGLLNSASVLNSVVLSTAFKKAATPVTFSLPQVPLEWNVHNHFQSEVRALRAVETA